MTIFRKTILSLILSSASCIAMAEAPKNCIGIRASFQPSWATSYGVKTSVRSGYMIGVIDQISLSRRLPFYLETGLSFTSKGYKIQGFDNSSTTINYLRIPLAALYRIPIGEHISIQPSAGVYYAYGLWGRLHYQDNSINVFSEKSISKNDFGYNLGVALTIDNFYIGVQYENGLIDIAKNDLIYPSQVSMLGYRSLKNYSFAITLGYTFNIK